MTCGKKILLVHEANDQIARTPAVNPTSGLSENAALCCPFPGVAQEKNQGYYARLHPPSKKCINTRCSQNENNVKGARSMSSERQDHRWRLERGPLLVGVLLISLGFPPFPPSHLLDVLVGAASSDAPSHGRWSRAVASIPGRFQRNGTGRLHFS